MPLLHPSGGLRYHLRAWRHDRQWAAFHLRVLTWLHDWRPDARELVLLGPSGGYALPAAWLARFHTLHVLEPDPLARLILRRRFPRAAFAFHTADDLAMPGGVARLVARHADAAFLFCNLLGQELVGQPAGFNRRAWLDELAAALQGRPWASWHELASTARRPARETVYGARCPDSLEDALALFWKGGELDIVDHETFGMAPGAPREYAIWQLLPERWHLIEWLRHPTPAGA